MRRDVGWLIVVMLGVGSVAGCDRLPWAKAHPAAAAPTVRGAAPARPVDASRILAEVNGVAITIDEFRRRLEGLSDEARPKTLDDRQRLLEELIGVELFVQDAKEGGIERDPVVAERLRDLEQLLLYQAAIQREVAAVTVTDADVEKFYKEYQAGFKEPERIRLKQIVIKTEADAKAVLVTLLQGTTTFEQVARERSVGAGAAQGGDLGYVIRASDKAMAEQSGQPVPAAVVFPQLEQAAFALEVGGISGIVKGPEGYVIVKLIERKEGRQRPLGEVWNQVREGLLLLKQQQHFAEKMSALRSKARVTIHPERLSQLTP